MTRMLVPNDGNKGLNIETADGKTRTLNADRSGAIDTGGDKKLEKVLRAEGYTVAGVGISLNVEGFPCECGFSAVFRICGRCGKDNG
jgi:hypothetical protein